MQWFRAHVYISALAAVGIVIIIGVLFVQSRSPFISGDTLVTWGGSVPTSAYQSEGEQSPQQIAQDMVQGQAVDVTLPALAASSSSSFAPASDASSSINYEALLEELSSPPTTNKSVSQSGGTNATVSEAYQYIPQGLVAKGALSETQMTPTQEALYEYGNEVGSEVQSFEELHSNEAEVIKDQAEDRTDPTKAAAVVTLGQALVAVGIFMQGMQTIPPSMQSFHNALAKSYIDIGTKLQLVPQASTDSAFVQAIENYDASANTFVHNYAAVAVYLSAQGVTFGPQDPGSVFSFSAAGGGGL